MSTIQRYSVELPAIGQVVSLQIPASAMEVALRVYDKYITPAPPPPPSVAVVAVVGEPVDPPAFVTRFFTLVADGQPLPANFLKYIATVPFGPDKQTVDIVEVSSAS
jgi:hypothetical protein